MSRDLGRLGQMLVGEEASYATTPTLLATMAVRHLNCQMQYNPKNRVMSDEKKGSPGRRARFDRATTAGITFEAYIRPSGTIGTIPEAHKIFQHGFGTTVVGTLDGSVASAASSTVMTLQSGEGSDITVGEFVSVKRAANSNIPEVRKVTVVSTDTITVTPALGGTPAANDTVKAGVTYRLADDLAKSLSFIRYLTNLTEVIKGAPIDELKLTFDRNEEAKFGVTCPAQQKGTPDASPGFTTVGAQNPPSGLVGGMILNGAAYKFMNVEFDIKNGIELISENYGTSMAEGYDRPNFREIGFSLEARVTDDLAAHALAVSAGQFPLFLQTGQTEGNIVALFAPAAELAGVPDISDSDPGAISYSFNGVCVESVEDSNDELTLGIL